MRLEIQEHVETETRPGYWSGDFWDDLRGKPSEWVKPEQVTRTRFDVVVNGAVLYTTSYRPHAEEWVDVYRRTAEHLPLVTEFEKKVSEYGRLAEELRKMQQDHPWLLSHKLKWVKP